MSKEKYDRQRYPWNWNAALFGGVWASYYQSPGLAIILALTNIISIEYSFRSPEYDIALNFFAIIRSVLLGMYGTELESRKKEIIYNETLSKIAVISYILIMFIINILIRGMFSIDINILGIELRIPGKG